MKLWKNLATTAILATLLVLCSGGIANAALLDFSQLDFNLDGTTTGNSDWGVVDLTFNGSSDILYFNLNVDGSWQVENMPVLSIQGGDVTQTQRFWFDLGNSVGSDVSSLSYGYELTVGTTGGMPSGGTFALVGDDQIGIYSGGEDVTMNTAPPPAAPSVGGVVADPVQHVIANFPNQEAGVNECAPTAISNSLQYLNARHNLGLDPTEITIAKMKQATKWKVPPRVKSVYIWDNVNGNAWWKDKDAFMKANNLPISTKRVMPANIGQIANEIDSGQDIEAELNGHTVAVVGIADLGDGTHSVTVSHDASQGVAGYTVRETGLWNGTSWSGALAGYGLNYFVVECPIPTGADTYPYVGTGLLALVAGTTVLFRKKKKSFAA